MKRLLIPSILGVTSFLTGCTSERNSLIEGNTSLSQYMFSEPENMRVQSPAFAKVAAGQNLPVGMPTNAPMNGQPIVGSGGMVYPMNANRAIVQQPQMVPQPAMVPQQPIYQTGYPAPQVQQPVVANTPQLPAGTMFTLQPVPGNPGQMMLVPMNQPPVASPTQPTMIPTTELGGFSPGLPSTGIVQPETAPVQEPELKEPEMLPISKLPMPESTTPVGLPDLPRPTYSGKNDVKPVGAMIPSPDRVTSPLPGFPSHQGKTGSKSSPIDLPKPTGPISDTIPAAPTLYPVK
ncbi:MAG: hypothetical protein R3B84_02075 [Zavarzinella sp.]